MAAEGMVHALSEARRVLRPGGILVDLRPAAKHRRVGLGEGWRWRLVGVMRETFDEDRAADRAVARAIRNRWFRSEARVAFVLDRVMDTIADFRAWLGEFGQAQRAASHRWLVRRLVRAARGESKRIVARGPMTLRVLRALTDPLGGRRTRPEARAVAARPRGSARRARRS